MRESYLGQLLVASSTVTDSMYANGVCLIVHDDGNRVIGVMLNRPLEADSAALATIFGRTDSDPRTSSRSQVQTDMGDQGSAQSVPASNHSPMARSLHFGGPLSGPIVALHQLEDYAEAETGDGIYVAAQKHHLMDLIQDQDEPCRLIVGHLEWESEELAAEITHGCWHMLPASVKDVFSSADEMWSSVIRRATDTSLAKWIGLPDTNAVGELN